MAAAVRAYQSAGARKARDCGRRRPAPQTLRLFEYRIAQRLQPAPQAELGGALLRRLAAGEIGGERPVRSQHATTVLSQPSGQEVNISVVSDSHGLALVLDQGLGAKVHHGMGLARLDSAARYSDDPAILPGRERTEQPTESEFAPRAALPLSTTAARISDRPAPLWRRDHQ